MAVNYNILKWRWRHGGQNHLALYTLYILNSLLPNVPCNEDVKYVIHTFCTCSHFLLFVAADGPVGLHCLRTDLLKPSWTVPHVLYVWPYHTGPVHSAHSSSFLLGIVLLCVLTGWCNMTEFYCVDRLHWLRLKVTPYVWHLVQVNHAPISSSVQTKLFLLFT